MWKSPLILLTSAALLSACAVGKRDHHQRNARPQLTARKIAGMQLGSRIETTGKLAQVVPTEKGDLFLNLDDVYPHQTLIGVTRGDLKQAQKLSRWIGREVKMIGILVERRGERMVQLDPKEGISRH